MWHGLAIAGTERGGVMDLETLRLRVACHVLIDYMPKEGLPEVMNTLAEHLRYYVTLPRGTKYEQLSEAPVRSVVVGSYENPGFRIDPTEG